MKQASLNVILSAQKVLQHAKQHCLEPNPYAVSLGVVLLQDGVELLLIACLIQLGLDDEEDLERLNFYDYLKLINKAGIKIPKAESLKALNKERNLVKHHGQMASELNVGKYLVAIDSFLEQVFVQVFGCSIYEIHQEEVLNEGPVKTLLGRAREAYAKGDYYDSCVNLSCTVTELFGHGFSVDGWEKVPESKEGIFFIPVPFNGHYAAKHAKTRRWIAKHVRDPLGYVQPDFKLLTADLYKYGINPTDFSNIYGLLPVVVKGGCPQSKGRLRKEWYAENKKYRWDSPGYGMEIDPHKLKEMTEYCFDKVMEFATKKQDHDSRYAAIRSFHMKGQTSLQCRILRETKLFLRASYTSNILATIPEYHIFYGFRVVPTFEDPNVEMVAVSGEIEGKREVVRGYVDRNDCELVANPTETREIEQEIQERRS